MLDVANAAITDGKNTEHGSETQAPEPDVDVAGLIAHLQTCWSPVRDLRSAPAKLRNQREVGLTALQRTVQCFPYVSDELRGDRNTVLATLRRSFQPRYFAFVSAELRSDKDMVLSSAPGCTSVQVRHRRALR